MTARLTLVDSNDSNLHNSWRWEILGALVYCLWYIGRWFFWFWNGMCHFVNIISPILQNLFLQNNTGNLWISQHLQITRFPKVIGFFTHLDFIKKSPTFKATKKTLENHFWTETLSLPRSLFRHRNHESRPFHFCHDIPSSETLIHTSSLIESKIALLENFQKKGKLYRNCLWLCPRNQSSVGTKVHIPVLVIWIWILLLF